MGDGECLEDNGTIVVTAKVKNEPTCANNDGEITVTAPLGPQYEYRLSTSSSWQPTPIFKNLAAGTYTVEAKDSESKGNVSVSVSGILCSINVTTTPTTCGDSNGTITVTAQGGKLPITYTLSGGTTPIINTTGKFTGLPSGILYTIKVEDSNTPVQILTSTQTVAPSSPLTITTSNIIGVTCFDGNDGSIDLRIKGGQIPYILSISSGSGFTPFPPLNQTPYLINGWKPFEATTYTLSVSDKSGCPAATSTFTIPNAAKIDITTTTKGASCGKSDGEVTITANNGLAPYTFRTDNTTYNTTNPISNLAAGNYNIFAKDANGCEANEPTKITTAGTLQFKPTSIEDGTYNGEYGWDDGSQYSQSQFLTVVAQNPTDYEKIDTKGCKEYFAPWLSLLPGKDKVVSINLLLDSDLQSYINSGKKVILTATAGISMNGNSTIEINSSNLANSIVTEIESSITTTPTSLGLGKSITAKDQDGIVIGKLNVVSGKPMIEDLNVYYVKHDANPVRADLSIADMENALNKNSHNQGLVNYNLTLGNIKGTTNGILDISKTFNASTDMDYNKILTRIHTSYPALVNSKRNIFITDISIIDGSSKTTGEAISMDNVFIYNKGETKTLIHEVGHLFDLKHTFCCNLTKENDAKCKTQLNGRCLPQNTTSNYMDYNKPEKTHFDFFQWKIIFSTAKIFN